MKRFYLPFLLFSTLLFTDKSFGQTPNGFLDFGSTANGTTATTGNTGFGGVRVGTQGGSFTIQNTGQSIGTVAELRGIAPTGGSINSVGISSTEYGTAATTFTVSFEVHLSGGSSGTWYFFAGSGTSFAATQSAGFTSSNIFTGIRWTYGASSTITTDNRNGNAWNATGITGTPFAQNTAYYVSIVGNNSASTVNYGASSSVAANKYDLWVNGTLVGNDLAKGEIGASATINAFRFYGENSTGNVAALAIDNVRWYNSCVLPPTHLVFASVPATGTTATNLSAFTATAYSGSTSGPVATAFTGAVTVAKASGTGNISGTLAPSAVAGVASYSNVQFDAADTYTISATAAAPIVSALSGNIVISASGTPEINIKGNGTSIIDGDVSPSTTDSTDFGAVCTGATLTRIYTIENTGSAALSVGAITFDGTNGSEFAVTSPPSSSVAAAGSTTFFVTFTPGGSGTRSAVMHIVNGDGNENPYDISLQGTGVNIVTPAVSIASSDADNIICAGTSVTFTATPTNGGTAPTYVWWKNGISTGTNVGTGSTYTTTTLANGDAIECVMTSNAACLSATTANSSAITTTVNALPAAPANPTAAGGITTVCTSTTLNTMTPPAGVTFYWQGTTNNGQSTSNGNSASTYTANVAGTNTYYVQARDDASLCWSSTSGSLAITVNTAVNISGQPTDQTVSTPTAAIFSITASNATYQWQLNTGSGWNDISGATSSTYNTGATNIGMNGYQYRCIAKGTAPCADVTSSTATLTVNLAASIIAQFDFTSTPYVNYTLKDANVTVTDVALSTGTIETNVTTGTEFPNEPYIAENDGGWTSVTQAGAKNFNFTITAAAGYEIQVTSIEFRALATSAGPSAFSYNIGSGLATYTTNAPSTTLVYINQTVTGVSGQTTLPVLIQGWLNGSRSSSGAGIFRLDDIIVKGYVTSVCTIPSSQASSVTTSSITPTGLNAGFTRGTSTGTILVIKPTAQTTAFPAQNTSYTGNVDWNSAAQINTNNRVLANSTATASSTVAVNGITNLTAETQYTLTAYERSATHCYNLASAPATTFYTLSTEPTAHSSSGLSSSSCNANSVDLTLPAPDWGADGYLVIYNSAGGASSGLPTDALSYAVGNTFGDATIAAIVTSSSTITVSGLSASTSYTFKLVPYNANAGGTAATYNYLTSGTLYSTSVSTPASSASTASIVSTDGTYSYTQNIDYASYQNDPVSTTSAQSIGVHNLIIQDGNGSSNDADNFSTLLKGITFTYTGTANTIRAAALFTTTGHRIRTATSVTANTITFSNLPDTVTLKTPNDNSNIQVILRVTFGATVTDNEKLVFTVSSLTSGDACSYSQFNGSIGTVTSDNGANDKNKIEVTATKLTFSNISNGAINTDLSSFTITAQDNNNNKDLDAAGSITLDCPDDSPNGSMSAGSYSLTAGAITIGSGIQFNALQTQIHLTASIASPSVNGTSNAFDIASVSYSGGAWLSKTGSGGYTASGSWCRCPNPGPCTGLTPGSGGWGALGATGTSPSSASNVYIQGTITLSGGSLGVTTSTILSGGNLIVNSQQPVSSSMTVKSGGTLTINEDFNFNNSSAIFEIEDGGNVIIDYYWNNDPTPPIWAGVEKFHPQSNLIIKNWDSRIYLADNNVTTNTYNGTTGMFGNIYINPGQDPNTNNGPYNLGIARQNWEMIGPNNASPVNFTHGTIEFQKAPYNTFSDIYQNIRFMGNPNSNTYDINVHGSIKLTNTAGAVYGATKGNFALNVDSNVTISSGSLSVRATQTATGNTTLNVSGNITMSGTSTLFLNQTQYQTANSPVKKSIINLKGHLTVGSTASVVSGCPYTESEFNFLGTTPHITQLINVASTFGGTSSLYLGIPISVRNNAYVQLNTNNLVINNGSSFTVETGDTLDFGFNGNTPLLLAQPTSSPIGSNIFTSQPASTLKITHTQGIDSAKTSVTIGNIQQIPKSNRNISPVATFWYIGKADQVTGDAIGKSTNARVVICDLASPTYTLTPSDTFGLTNSTTVSTTGGKLDIRVGQFTETETAYITGSNGTLYMSPGTLYKVLKGYSTSVTEITTGRTYIPRMEGTAAFPYILTGGTIELAGANTNNAFQTLRGDDALYNYKYVKFSGNNTYLSDYKNLSNQTTVDSAVIITGNAVVDCKTTGAGSAASFVGDGGLMMDGGRIRIKKLNTANPELDGNNVAYSLTGGTVEFYGGSDTSQQQIRGNYRTSSPLKISYYDIDINAALANYDTTKGSGASNAGNVDMNSSFLLKHNLTVYSPAVLRMDQDEFIDDALNPSNSITVQSGAGLLYGNQNGIKTSGTGVNDGNIRTSGTRSLSTGASYGFVGPNDMESGSGLPPTIAGLYIYKSVGQKIVTLTNSVDVTGTLNFYRGIVTTGSNTLTVSNGSKTAITGHEAPFTASSGAPAYADDRYVIGNLERYVNSAGIYVYPVGDVVSGEAYNPLRFNVGSGTGNATAQFIPGDPGIITVGPVFFNCGSVQKGYNYSDMTTEGKWRMTSSTGTSFGYDVYLHPNVKNVNTTPNVYIDTLTGTNYLIDYRALKAPNGTTDWSAYANTGDICVSSYYYNILGSGFTGFSDFAPAGGNTNTTSQLPVELISFTAECNENENAILRWSTASELNSKEYVVEQSTDGVTFTPVTIVAAAGNSNSLRSYVSTVPLSTFNRTYYRLKMIDLDNSFEYSNTILLNCGNNNNYLSIYYSPSEGIVLQTQASSSNSYILSLYDATGKLIWNETKLIESGNNKYILDVRNKLANGIYFIRAGNGTGIYSQKLWIH